MNTNIRLDVCPHCELGEIDLTGCDPIAVTEVLTSLSSQTPEDPRTVGDNELEQLRLSDIQEWRGVGDDGTEMARVLEDLPQIVKANHACDTNRFTGSCLMKWAEGVKREIREGG